MLSHGRALRQFVRFPSAAPTARMVVVPGADAPNLSRLAGFPCAGNVPHELNSLPMLSHWQPIAQNAAAIATDHRQTEDVRGLATATLDLLTLVATWPLARWQRFDEHLAYSVLRLCRCTGQAICNADDLCAMDVTRCPVIRDRLGVIDSYSTGGIGG